MKLPLDDDCGTITLLLSLSGIYDVVEPDVNSKNSGALTQQRRENLIKKYV